MSKSDKYHIQRVVVDQVRHALNTATTARDSLELLMLRHPEGLVDGWDKDDLECLSSHLTDAIHKMGEFFFDVRHLE